MREAKIRRVGKFRRLNLESDLLQESQDLSELLSQMGHRRRTSILARAGDSRALMKRRRRIVTVGGIAPAAATLSELNLCEDE